MACLNTTEFWATQGRHMQITRKLLKKETDKNGSFCYSMILEMSGPVFHKMNLVQIY